MSAEIRQFFFELTAADLAHLDRQRAFVSAIAARIGLDPAMQGATSDLLRLQAIVDSGILKKEQTWELQSLGIVLGDVFEKNSELHWAIVEDEHGRDPALRFRDTSNLIFPMTMISKRIEDEKPVRIINLYDGVMDYVEQFSE